MECCTTENEKHRNDSGHGEKGVFYTCPMHPEVREKHPGMCPECGMNLVPDKASHTHDGEHGKHVGHSTNIFKRKFWVSLFLTIPVVLYSPLFTEILGIQLPLFPGTRLLPIVFGSIVFFYGGLVFIESAWRELQARLPGMMTLIAIAITAAYSYSLFATFYGGETLFWELTTLVTIMLLGHWIEMRAVSGTQGALKELAKLLPDTAEVVRENSVEIVPLDELKSGDKIRVRPGSKVPADGTILSGQSSLNEAAVTGESQPVDKGKGDTVIAGTINGDGSLTVRVDKIGDDTFLAGVMRLIREAQASKSRLQILSDRAARYLTAVALSVGILSFGIWTLVGAGVVVAMTRLVTVLIIACPHALGLAVPLVASISTTKAAQNGFLVKERIALESARSVTTVLFDKTGTLTKGEFGVQAVIAVQENREKDILATAASLNNHSEHPLGQAMVKEAKNKNLSLIDPQLFERVPGKGVKGIVENKEVVVGNKSLLHDFSIDVPTSHEEYVSSLVPQGVTVVHVGVDGVLWGSIALADVIREESREAILSLRNRGIRTAMITGDSDEVARWVASELGIETVFSQVLPHEKSERVKELQSQGESVAMVGDGINDAPALMQADLGVAVGAGTNVAIESAGIVLVRDDPRDIMKIIRLSDLTYRKMVQNLWWAAGYNIAAIPLAAGALAWAGIVLQPAVGAVLMSASTVIVAFNAALLKSKEI